MKIVTLEQNSRDWKTWRNKGLGASTAATVLGISPWSTPFELWLELTGLCERAPSNEYAIAAMRRGHELEPVARARFERQIGKAFPPLCAENDEHSFIKASLDGYNAQENAILEIKCPGKVDHAKALKGQIPDKYYAQVQHQLLVTGASLCYYYSYDGKDSDATVLVKPDSDYIDKLTKALLSFWQKVQLQLPPEHTQEDLQTFVKRAVADLARAQNSLKALSILAGELP
jgi:putative phage-type endonuclease